MSEIWFRTGEATVLAAEGQYTDAMPEVLIGSTRGPAGQAFAGMMGQVQGHTRMFVVRDLNQLVRPATIMTTKVTIHTAEYAELLGGVVQAATGDAIIDCVIEGVLPKEDREAHKAQAEATRTALKARLAPFATETFDAAAYVKGQADDAAKNRPAPGAQLAAELAVLVPLLTEPQRTKLAAKLEK